MLAEEFERLASSERAWEVTEKSFHEMNVSPIDPIKSALKVLSTIDVEPYLIDRVTRNLIDSSLAILQARLYEDRGNPNRRG